MAGEISNYATEVTVIEGDIDLIDVSVLISTGPNVYDSQKAKAQALLTQRLPFGLVQSKKASGNTDLTADEIGDWRERVNGSGNFVIEVWNGSVWLVRLNLLKGF